MRFVGGNDMGFTEDMEPTGKPIFSIPVWSSSSARDRKERMREITGTGETEETEEGGQRKAESVGQTLW